MITGELIDQLAQLTSAPIAQAQNLDAEVARGAHLSNDAGCEEAETVYLEPHFKLIANLTTGGKMRLDEAAIEA